nr:U4 prorein [Milk vetch dwarf virus]
MLYSHAMIYFYGGDLFRSIAIITRTQYAIICIYKDISQEGRHIRLKKSLPSEEIVLHMEPRFLLVCLLFVVLLQPAFVFNMVLGYILGYLIKKNYARLKVMFLTNTFEHPEEDQIQPSVEKNPFEDIDPDVIKHLKTLGLDTSLDGEDLAYLQRFWESMSVNKNK